MDRKRHKSSDMIYFRMEFYAEAFLNGSNDSFFQGENVFRAGVSGGVYDYKRLLLINLCSSQLHSAQSALVYQPCCRNLHVPVRKVVVGDTYDCGVRALRPGNARTGLPLRDTAGPFVRRGWPCSGLRSSDPFEVFAAHHRILEETPGAADLCRVGEFGIPDADYGFAYCLRSKPV